MTAKNSRSYEINKMLSGYDGDLLSSRRKIVAETGGLLLAEVRSLVVISGHWDLSGKLILVTSFSNFLFVLS